MKYFKLTNEEKKILEDFENDQFVSVKNKSRRGNRL